MSDENQKNQTMEEGQDTEQVTLDQGEANAEMQKKRLLSPTGAVAGRRDQKKLKAENAELKDKYLRLFAEFDNFKSERSARKWI